MIAQLASELGLPIERDPLWSRFPASEFIAAEQLDERSYRQLYEHDAFTDDEKWFPSVKSCIEIGVGFRDVVQGPCRFVTGVDLSGKKRKGNFLVTLAIGDGVMALADARHGRWTSPQTAEQMGAIDAEHDPDVFVVETNAYQTAIVEWSEFVKDRFAFWSKIHEFTTGTNKADAQTGIRSLEIQFRHRAIVFPFATKHPVACKCSPCELIRQIDAFPNGDDADGVMALWFAREGARQWLGTVSDTALHPSEAGARGFTIGGFGMGAAGRSRWGIG